MGKYKPCYVYEDGVIANILTEVDTLSNLKKKYKEDCWVFLPLSLGE